MSSFSQAMESFLAAVQSEQAWVEELNDCSKRVAGLYSVATASEVDGSLRQLAALLPNLREVALGQVAITCGSLVEHGGDPGIAGPLLLERLPRLSKLASEFYMRCRELAQSDAELVESWRDEAAANIETGDDANSLTSADIIHDQIENQGWHDISQRFGPQLFKSHPDSVFAYMAEEFFRLALIAHLSRSKSLRQAARAHSEYLSTTLQSDEVSGSHRSFLATMLQVLDDERLLVLHVDQRKGFEIRISGIADNFQLHTLLAGAIIGSPAQGMVSGRLPSPQAVAVCRDKPTRGGAAEHVTGAFNLWNWTAGLRPDKHLPSGQANHDHWIWNEGNPAEIASFEGCRVVLVGPSPIERFWSAGRTFQGMVGELTVERRLSEAEFDDWLNRLARAVSS